MASKLEKAQYKYESLLRKLGDKARLVGLIDKADESVLDKYRQAEENLDDRKIEMDFIQSEIDSLEKKLGDRQNTADGKLAELEAQIKDIEERVDIKHSKADPFKKKIAGATYDLKFVEKGLEEEKRKFKEKIHREEFKAAKDHEANIKKLKIEVLKRRKAIMDMKRQIKELEVPAKKLERELDALKKKLEDLEEKTDHSCAEEDEELLDEMRKQHEIKVMEIIRSEKHLKDILADVGESLYEKRMSHPVLNKFYADLDLVSKTIDGMQEE